MNLEKFNHPGQKYRPAPFWSWNDKLDNAELKRQIREMAEKGWGGYFMHSRVGLVTGYLSPEWMECVRACVEEAGETNTSAWLYDEDKWPSGFAGGEVAEKEEYRSRALVLLKEDELTENDEILGEFEHDGVRRLICKRVSPLGNAWFNGYCYVDLMNPEAVGYFIKCTHERYKEACGEHFGKEIPGIFTDEPCYLMAGFYNIPVLPWSEYLPGYFQKLKGYSILEHLPELFFDVEDFQRVRFDFFDSATRLFLESFTKKYFEWCDRNNLIMTGHFMAEDNLVSQLEWIGAAMPHYEFMHWPGIDKLGRHIDQVVTVKQVSSAADQLGKERAFCEVFGCVGQQVSFFHRKWIADWQAALGISFVNHHLSLYSMRGERKRDFPANLFYQQPWWDYEKGLSDYIARLSYAVSAGKRNVDILVIHPIASAWSSHSPVACRNELRYMQGGDDLFDKLSKELAANNLDYHYGDEIIMENHARIEDGKLAVDRHKYSTVVVPAVVTLRSNTVKLLKEFMEASDKNKLILMLPLAKRVDGVKTRLDWPSRANIADSLPGLLKVLDEIYPGRIKTTDEMTGKNAPEIICHERSSDDGKWLFMANTSETREIRCSISIPGEDRPYALDLTNGAIYGVPYRVEGGRTEIRAKFHPAGSLLLFFPSTLPVAGPSPLFLDTGVEFDGIYETQFIIKDFDAAPLEQNVLPLNDVILYLDGKQTLHDKPVAMAWHEHFYKAPEGTPFRAEYKFDVLNIPNGEVFAAVEMAENLDAITINGIKAGPLKKRGETGEFSPDRSWKDISFTKVPLTGLLQKGTNVLALEGRKSNNITGPGTHIRVKDFKNHYPTEVETVYIVGDFNVVSEDRINFFIDGNVKSPCHCDFTSSGYPFYAGKAEFKALFEYGGDCAGKDSLQAVLLKVNDVSAACVELYLNGKPVGAKYWSPYLFDITGLLKNGRNEIRLVAAATLFNLMGPNRIAGIKEDQFIGPQTFVDFGRYTEKYALEPFGIGSISIIRPGIK